VLQPQHLQWTVRNGLWAEKAEAGLGDSSESGCCDIVCPSHIPLVSWFRHGKSQLRRLDAERQAADSARRRFEAREERLARLKQERRHRLEEKKRALRGEKEKQERIAAAIDRVRSRREGNP
jgi:electron transport complex protein RnfC